MASGIRIGKLKITTIKMIEIILIITSFGGLFISSFQTSNIVYYFADILNIVLLFFAVRKKNELHKIKEMKPLLLLFIIFLCDNLIGIIGNDVAIGLVLWGIRNIFRYVIFFVSCIILLEIENIKSFEKKLPILYILNFGLIIVQSMILGHRQDFVGGIFGTAQGCNGALTIFLNIVFSFFLSEYLYGKLSLVQLGIYAIMYFFSAAISETKGNYVFFLVIVVVAVIISKKSFKTAGIIIAAAVAFFVGIYFLNMYFPDSLEFLINWESANRYMDATYFGKITFTRNAIFSTANEFFFKNNNWLYLFGYGVGACDMSSFFESPFYQQYGYMNYRQYGAAMTLLQNGYIGLLTYFAFFIVLFIITFKALLKEKDINVKIVMSASCCITIFSIIDSFYASLYIDAAYWLFFVLSLPFVILKSQKKQNKYSTDRNYQCG